MLNSRQRLGKKGEDTVALYLQKHGYTILVRNYRCKMGEIDIIARNGPELVFIEVKTRSGLNYGSPAEAVTTRKQRQISRTAQWYLAERNLFNAAARFDVISLLSDNTHNDQIDHIDHIRNAFDLCE